MDKQTLLGLLAAAPVAGLFLVLLAAMAMRTRQNASSTPAGRQWTALRWIVIGLAFAVASYFIIERDHFAPSWTFTAWAVFGAFLAGEAFGRWTAERTMDNEVPTSRSTSGKI